jgi:hypothetical protein
MGLTGSEDAPSKDKVVPLIEQRGRRDRTPSTTGPILGRNAEGCLPPSRIAAVVSGRIELPTMNCEIEFLPVGDGCRPFIGSE